MKKIYNFLASVLMLVATIQPAFATYVPPGIPSHLTITPTVTAGAYTTGQVVGGLISLTNAAQSSGGGGYIQSVNIGIKTTLTGVYDVYFFDTQPTNGTYTDNASFALNVADIPFLVGVAHVWDLSSDGTPQTLQAANINLPFRLNTGTTLYAVIVIRAGQTFASSSAVILNVMVTQ